jgi:hypothetical protein
VLGPLEAAEYVVGRKTSRRMRLDDEEFAVVWTNNDPSVVAILLLTVRNTVASYTKELV